MSRSATTASSLVTTVPSFFLLVKSAVMTPVLRPELTLTSLILTSSTPWWPSNRTLPLNAVSELCVEVSYVPLPSVKVNTPLPAACWAPSAAVILPWAMGPATYLRKSARTPQASVPSTSSSFGAAAAGAASEGPSAAMAGRAKVAPRAAAVATAAARAMGRRVAAMAVDLLAERGEGAERRGGRG